MKTDKGNLHEGHRQRLKNRFLKDGSFDNFEPHNILEMLLFYSIPRKDTNEIAHNLLKRFGSIKNVLDASFDELVKVSGISENSATLIKILPQIARIYATHTVAEDRIFDSVDKIGDFFVSQYMGEKNEVVYLMLLANNFELIALEKIHEGDVNSSFVTPRKISDLVTKHNAAMIVLAHNHPNGIGYPSMNDIETTSHLLSLLNSFDINLIEHFVVGGNTFYPLISSTETLRRYATLTPSIYGDKKFNKQ